MKRITAAIMAAIVVVLLAACGGHTTTATVTIPTPPGSVLAPAPAVTQLAAGCAVGRSFMGCSTVQATKPTLTLSPSPAGPRFPDVSSFQGHPNWAAARLAGIAGAVAKLGEGESIIDPSASYNVAEFKRLKIPFAVYWFVRPDSCSAEGAELEHAAATVGGVPLIVLDEEVPGISGLAACLNPYVHHATGKDAVVYRSSGNDFDDSAPEDECWVAAYGPSATPTCSSRHVVAFQFTDGRFGFPVFIPGVGQGDVSTDHGLLALSHPKPNVNPHHWDWLPNSRRTYVIKAFSPVWGAPRKVQARERASIRNWDQAGCGRPVKRAECRRWQIHMQLEARRISYVAHHAGRHLHHKAHKPRWGALHYRAKDGHKTTLGGAYRQLHRRTTRHGHVTHW